MRLFMDADVASAPNTVGTPRRTSEQVGVYHTVPLTPVWGLRMLILRALGAMEGAERGVL